MYFSTTHASSRSRAPPNGAVLPVLHFVERVRPTAPRPSELLEEETLAAAARATTVGRKMVVDPETDKKS